MWHPSLQHSSTMLVDELARLIRRRKRLASLSSTITDPTETTKQYLVYNSGEALAYRLVVRGIIVK